MRLSAGLNVLGHRFHLLNHHHERDLSETSGSRSDT
jgi:hypothetical protein